MHKVFDILLSDSKADYFAIGAAAFHWEMVEGILKAVQEHLWNASKMDCWLGGFWKVQCGLGGPDSIADGGAIVYSHANGCWWVGES